MGTNSISIVYETDHAAVVVWQQVVVLAIRELFAPPTWQAAVHAIDARAVQSPTCLLSLFGERTQLPEAATLLEGTRALYGTRAVCRARVVPGQGQQASATRWMLEKAARGCGDNRPNAEFEGIPQACDWLGKVMGKDAGWRLSLGAVAGTILYGTPSYSRRSQVSRYLTEDCADDGTGKGKNGEPPRPK